MSKNVKLLLKESIRSIGRVGDIVEVSAGYARNYLLPQDLAVQPPAHAAVVILLIVEGETGFLQRGEVAADRAGGDVEIVSEGVDGRAVPGRLQRVEHLPLPDDFLVPGHGPIMPVP